MPGPRRAGIAMAPVRMARIIFRVIPKDRVGRDVAALQHEEGEQGSERVNLKAVHANFDLLYALLQACPGRAPALKRIQAALDLCVSWWEVEPPSRFWAKDQAEKLQMLWMYTWQCWKRAPTNSKCSRMLRLKMLLSAGADHGKIPGVPRRSSKRPATHKLGKFARSVKARTAQLDPEVLAGLKEELCPDPEVGGAEPHTAVVCSTAHCSAVQRSTAAAQYTQYSAVHNSAVQQRRAAQCSTAGHRSTAAQTHRRRGGRCLRTHAPGWAGAARREFFTRRGMHPRTLGQASHWQARGFEVMLPGLGTHVHAKGDLEHGEIGGYPAEDDAPEVVDSDADGNPEPTDALAEATRLYKAQPAVLTWDVARTKEFVDSVSPAVALELVRLIEEGIVGRLHEVSSGEGTAEEKAVEVASSQESHAEPVPAYPGSASGSGGAALDSVPAYPGSASGSGGEALDSGPAAPGSASGSGGAAIDSGRYFFSQRELEALAEEAQVTPAAHRAKVKAKHSDVQRERAAKQAERKTVAKRPAAQAPGDEGVLVGPAHRDTLLRVLGEGGRAYTLVRFTERNCCVFQVKCGPKALVQTTKGRFGEDAQAVAKALCEMAAKGSSHDDLVAYKASALKKLAGSQA